MHFSPQIAMSRLEKVQVQTRINDIVELLKADIPINDELELSKYVEDSHRILYKLLQAEKIRNPQTCSRYLNISDRRLQLLRAAWENYMFDYYDGMIKTVTVGKRSLQLYSLFWKNFCVLNSVLLKRKYNNNFSYSNAKNIKYVRTNLLCLSSKSIGEYSMSELLSAARTLSLRKWLLPWSNSYVNYLLQLEFVASERITWLGTAEDSSYYDEGCTKDSSSGNVERYTVSLETTAWLAQWFHSQKKRTRDRMRLQKWLSSTTTTLYIDQLAVTRLHRLLRQTASSIHDVTRFLRPLKNLILQNCVREGEAARYSAEHGSKNASSKDILRAFRPVNYIAYREDDLFNVSSVCELLDDRRVVLQQYKQLLQLYLINQVFYTTDGCSFNWMKFYVCFEKDFSCNYNTIKHSDQPLLLQSFTHWYVYYEGQAWSAEDSASAFIGWLQLLRKHCDCKLQHSIDVSPIADLLFANDADAAPTIADVDRDSDIEMEDSSQLLLL